MGSRICAKRVCATARRWAHRMAARRRAPHRPPFRNGRAFSSSADPTQRTPQRDVVLSALTKSVRRCAQHRAANQVVPGSNPSSALCPFFTPRRRRCESCASYRRAGECSFIYRYLVRESCSQFDSLPLTYLTYRRAAALVRAAGGRTRSVLGARVVAATRSSPSMRG